MAEFGGFLKRYAYFFAILFLPMMVLALVRCVPLMVLPADTAELKSQCFLRGFEQYEAGGKLKDPDKPNEKCVGAAPPPKPKTVTEKPVQLGLARDKDTKDDKEGGATGEQPKKKKPDARTLVQYRAVDVSARADFGIASGVMQAVALGGFLFALIQLVSSWNELRVRDPAQTGGAVASDRPMLVAFALLAVACAVVMVCQDVQSKSLDNALMDELFKKSAGLIPDTAEAAFKAFRDLIRLNLLAAYTAGALLLVYLAVLALPADPLGDANQRLGGLQFIVLIGAALFALSAVANNAAIAWATLGIDSESGAALIEATGAIPKLWSLASSGFLITAIILGYAGIRANAPPPKAPDPNKQSAAPKDSGTPNAPPKDSAIALRTPSGDDFKAFGWIVQFIIALAPIWAPASIAKIFDLVKTIP